MDPEYCENVIAGILYKRTFNWYITSKLIWRMDYRKEYKMWQDFYTDQSFRNRRITRTMFLRGGTYNSSK